MKKAAFVVALASFVALFVAGCGGGEDKSCTLSEECVAGEVCVGLLCVESVCNGKGDCSTGEICVPGELVGKDAGWKFCSWPLCDNVTKLCDVDQTCTDGICVDNTVTPDVVEDTIVTDTGRDTVVEDVPAELPPIEEEVDCKTCTINSDCGTGYTCQPVGAEKHCLRDCNNDGDCMGGYTCIAAGLAKSCLPVSYNCVACTFDTPCEEGKCCDFNSGSCKTCEEECFTCTYDYDCAAGLRCYKTTGVAAGVCVPECVDGACTDSTNYACNDNGKGVELCVPKTDGCKGCEEPTPWPMEGVGCVECRNNDDCEENEACKTDTHECITDECGTGTIMCDDGSCKQCCVDDDCLRFEDATGVCNPDGTCEGVVPCDGLCSADFPVCAIVGGVEQCVQCAENSDCALIDPACTCVGDPLYSCMDETGAICQTGGTGTCGATCEDASDCPPTATGGEMGCASVQGAATGLCYDPAGTCDGATSCCAPGQGCFDLMLLIMGAMGGGMMPFPEGVTSGSGYCGCETADDCINGKECFDLSLICALGGLLGQFAAMIELVCPGGSLSPSMPGHLCMSLADLFGGII